MDMGNWLNNILIEQTTPDEMKHSINQALKPLGFIPAVDEDGAEITIRIFGRPEDRFLVLTTDYFQESLPDATKRIAKACKANTISIQCLDSDVLLVSLTKGGAMSTVCMGDPRAYDLGSSAVPRRAMERLDWGRKLERISNSGRRRTYLC